ncbi:MAG TPA: YigZ family protein [Bacteroidales bacterium]|nr:YigZ family protein [Bacteroidales bacterium]HPI68771.1 YigZ family protein [Bacteroidales bacterium]HPR72252.1 YigZ family protein [Bacteroidales bacterium]
MDIQDTYKTIKKISYGLYREKGSKFIALASPVSDEHEVKRIIDEVKKEHHDAKHHCYAYVLGKDEDVWRINDDGEPSGTAGRPILGQIKSFGLTNILIIVTRYFGGKLLGVSGLTIAYKTAARSALENASFIERVLSERYELKYPYSAMQNVMTLLKEYDIEQSEHVFDLTCKIVIQVRLSLKEDLLSRLSRIDDLTINHLAL